MHVPLAQQSAHTRDAHIHSQVQIRSKPEGNALSTMHHFLPLTYSTTPAAEYFVLSTIENHVHTSSRATFTKKGEGGGAMSPSFSLGAAERREETQQPPPLTSDLGHALKRYGLSGGRRQILPPDTSTSSRVDVQQWTGGDLKWYVQAKQQPVVNDKRPSYLFAKEGNGSFSMPLALQYQTYIIALQQELEGVGSQIVADVRAQLKRVVALTLDNLVTVDAFEREVVYT